MNVRIWCIRANLHPSAEPYGEFNWCCNIKWNTWWHQLEFPYIPPHPKLLLCVAVSVLIFYCWHLLSSCWILHCLPIHIQPTLKLREKLMFSSCEVAMSWSRWWSPHTKIHCNRTHYTPQASIKSNSIRSGWKHTMFHRFYFLLSKRYSVYL